MNNKQATPRFMYTLGKSVLVFVLLCGCLQMASARSLSGLTSISALLSESAEVKVVKKTDSYTLFAWELSEGRKIDRRTLAILKSLGKFASEEEQVFFHLSVFNTADNAEAAGQSLLVSQYKAKKIKQALSKLAPHASVEAIGLGSKMNENYLYLWVSTDKPSAIKMIALPMAEKTAADPAG